MDFSGRNPHAQPEGSLPPFLSANGPSFTFPPATPPQSGGSATQFDIFSWQPKYASCQRFFLDHAQHSGPVQAIAAFLNILLPFQRNPPVLNSAPTRSPLPHPTSSTSSSGSPSPAATMAFQPAPAVSLFPYLRRLVVTGMDFEGVLHGFFGDDWREGVGYQYEQEKRNYLFIAKSGGWKSVKRDYDISPMETVPFLRPLQGVVEAELGAAERSWSEWLAMEDWMVGPRAPDAEHHSPSDRR